MQHTTAVGPFNLDFSRIDISWQPLMLRALAKMDQAYLEHLGKAKTPWLPGANNIFNAFSLPLPSVNVILFGESPYPRAQSANGYAFWDGQVDCLWSAKGLSTAVNRATSLRNFLKMLLVAEGLLSPDDVSQNAIADINKARLVPTASILFTQMLMHGILLLNASLVLSEAPVAQDAKAWRPFIAQLLADLASQQSKVTLLLMGNISKVITGLPAAGHFQQIICEHPYNISFIYNPTVIEFFKPLHLLLNMKITARHSERSEESPKDLL